MARIPDDQLHRLKQDISLQRLAEGMGIVLKRHGADLIGLCPFHDDRNPSLVISPKNNLWHCLGACQAGGSVIDWVMKAEGVSFRHAVELLQADAVQGGTNVARGRKPGATYQPLAAGPVKRSTAQKLPTTLEASAEDARLLAQVIDYYHESLKQSPEALAYLEKRGIANGEAIARFKLGFANRTLGYRLPAKNRKEGAAIRGQLQRIGLMRASGHEHFTGSLVIPVINETGPGHRSLRPQDQRQSARRDAVAPVSARPASRCVEYRSAQGLERNHEAIADVINRRHRMRQSAQESYARGQWRDRNEM